MASVILGSVQPAYLAWIPFYLRMSESDVFVYLDDVEYSKNSFHNRNMIKTPNGPMYLTVPVKYKGNSRLTIREMPIDNISGWQRKHWRAISLNYAKAPFFSVLGPLLQDKIYSRQWSFLGDLNYALLELFREFIGINTPCYLSSESNVEGQANEKLVNLCKKYKSDSFIVKPGTEHYHPKEYFEAAGIGFTYFVPDLKEYPQLHGEFVKGLGILDFAMNCGPDSIQLLK